MECPHLSDFDKINASPNLSTILTTSINGGTKNHPHLHKPQARGTRSSQGSQAQTQHQCLGKSNSKLSTNVYQFGLELLQHVGTLRSSYSLDINPPKLAIAVCKSDRSPWMCVLCGQVHCGRYVIKHSQLNMHVLQAQMTD